MKFKNRIFWLCIIVYLTTLTATGIVVTKESYNVLLKTEIDRCINEEKNAQYNITLYQISNAKINDAKVNPRNYCNSVKDMFGSKETYIEFYGFDLNLVASNVPYKWNFKREELNTVVSKGSNYILRTVNKKHYIFITDIIKSDYDEVIMVFIKDISYVYEHKKEQYLTFFKSGVIGLIIVALGTLLTGNLLVSPIQNLGLAAKDIASGNYSKRATIVSKDEVGFLSEQFNIMADEIEKKINELNDESDRKQEFINNLTHELRTPLTSIIGYSELLMKIQYEPELYKKSLGYIHSEGNRMLKMTNTLKQIILMKNAGGFEEQQDILPILIEVSEIMKVKAQSKEIKFDVYGESSIVKIDRDLIKEVIINLVDNAINASFKEGKIIISCKKEGTNVDVLIKDYGKGLSKEELNRVMEPFYRVDTSRSRKDGGMGLGLSICSEIIKAHGAKLTLDSKQQIGTTARITFTTFLQVV